ncbi:MAG: hypothetical protein LBI99_06780, partial [Propionibacteriaceae bacterium]|nr:hypothetical protein [Propionibacteriaceae bacterium]
AAPARARRVPGAKRGADALQGIFSWRRAGDIFDLAHFIGVTRPGVAIDPAFVESLPKDRVSLVEVPALAISSTDCRTRVAADQPIWYLVPDGIVQYIAKRGLYRPTAERI